MPGKDRMMTLAISASSVDRSRSLRELDGILQRTGQAAQSNMMRQAMALGRVSLTTKLAACKQCGGLGPYAIVSSIHSPLSLKSYDVNFEHFCHDWNGHGQCEKKECDPNPTSCTGT
jgi:hypothetical protein